jgi:uncharacterized protein (DUF2252 family)
VDAVTNQTIGRSEGPGPEKQAAATLRKQIPRASHGDWSPAADRPDPIRLLQQGDQGRLQHLLPIKYGRMLASPFAFLRGSAVVMASDLATTPVTGLNVALCGDAHLSNFGIFATPERNVVFDINDFDETYFGPWEWDVKRLAASAVVAGRGNGFDDKTCRMLASRAARAYREAIRRAATMTHLEVWYFHFDDASVIELFNKYARKSAGRTTRTIKQARAQTSGHTLDKLTHMVDGQRQIVNAPPLVVRLSELMSDEQKAAARQQGDVAKTWKGYLDSLPEERRVLLNRYRIADAALRVGGIGSVGTRCAIALLQGDKPEDALILQQKEVGPSVLEAYLPQKMTYTNQAQRVVIGQHLMQAASDIFLGWSSLSSEHHYYWRQFRDMKGSFDVTGFDAAGFATYLTVCGLCLARAHARSGDAIAISNYLGSGTVFDDAIGQFAIAYAGQTERDYQALVDAVNKGQIAAETGV